ncbi:MULTISPECIES: hypothetical protein [unclassified Treponema]|uniref:hypothetical protein n=1 Tax=unclassified Treponema TaxID=2638727 RepID=UPI0020A437C5|nr:MULTISPECIES: hypothetical protein [unclassified Treponema]UTC66334.1 hypothetical protein E4O06_10170 [Treponema sp. OMZ 789]UTC69064.1 hypothetical protein E4O01_10315 [Treponema sp. OMZ 790]UTC71776.1 hypothetical protein E4O02_10405 [Treponema sp. OMZ 791]
MKKFSFFEEVYGFKRHRNVYYGRHQGLYCIFTSELHTGECKLSLGAYKDGDETALTRLLEPLNGLKRAKFKVEKARIIINYKMLTALTTSKENEKNKEFFDRIISIILPILKENGYQSGGFANGKDDGSIRLARLGLEYLFLTENEFHDLGMDLKIKKEADKEKSENFLLGILGVIGVAICGVILYTLVGRAGYYVWMVPALLSVGASNVYKKLAGKLTIKAFVCMFVILTAALIAGTYLEYAWRFYDILKAEFNISFSEAFKEIGPLIFEDSEVKASFLKDFGINGGILILLTIIMFFSSYKGELRFQDLEWV